MWISLVVLVGSALTVNAYWGTPYCNGQRDTIVHLFEWKWNDIAQECGRLAELGYCAVQVSRTSSKMDAQRV